MIALASSQPWKTISKGIVAMCYTHQIVLCHQPCHRGFTARITDSTNKICTVNHAMKDLQHRILYYSKYCSLHCHMKMDRAREREKRLSRQREQYGARRERETEEQRQCMYYCFPITAHVMVCYNSQKTIG